MERYFMEIAVKRKLWLERQLAEVNKELMSGFGSKVLDLEEISPEAKKKLYQKKKPARKQLPKRVKPSINLAKLVKHPVPIKQERFDSEPEDFDV